MKAQATTALVPGLALQACFSGFTTGTIVLVVLGAIAEAGFWWRALPHRRGRDRATLPEA